jgi:hypothetical protein
LWQAPGPGVLDLEQEHVLVAVDVEVHDPEGVARLLALDPELAARAAPVGRLAGADRVGERLGVHEREHQHLAGGVVHRDAGDQAVRAELRLEERAQLDLGGRGARGKWGGSPWEGVSQGAGEPAQFPQVVVRVKPGPVAVAEIEADGVVADLLPAETRTPANSGPSAPPPYWLPNTSRSPWVSALGTPAQQVLADEGLGAVAPGDGDLVADELDVGGVPAWGGAPGTAPRLDGNLARGGAAANPI